VLPLRAAVGIVDGARKLFGSGLATRPASSGASACACPRSLDGLKRRGTGRAAEKEPALERGASAARLAEPLDRVLVARLERQRPLEGGACPPAVTQPEMAPAEPVVEAGALRRGS
jgi:hypothetical protein